MVECSYIEAKELTPVGIKGRIVELSELIRDSIDVGHRLRVATAVQGIRGGVEEERGVWKRTRSKG